MISGYTLNKAASILHGVSVTSVAQFFSALALTRQKSLANTVALSIVHLMSTPSLTGRGKIFSNLRMGVGFPRFPPIMMLGTVIS